MDHTIFDLFSPPDARHRIERAAADLPRIRRCLRVVALLDRLVPRATLSPDTRKRLGGYLFEEGPLLVSMLAREIGADPALFAALAPDPADAADARGDTTDARRAATAPRDSSTEPHDAATPSADPLGDLLRGGQTRADGWMILHRVLLRLAGQALALHMLEQSAVVRTTLTVLRTVRDRARDSGLGRVPEADLLRADALALAQEVLRRWQQKKAGNDRAR